MIQCYGKVICKKSRNYSNRCSLILDECSNGFYCQYHQFQRNNKAIVVERVKKLLADCENARGNDAKRVVVVEMMNYLLDNIKFVHSHAKFRFTVIKKLYEFEDSDEWDGAMAHREKMEDLLEKHDIKRTDNGYRDIVREKGKNYRTLEIPI